MKKGKEKRRKITLKKGEKALKMPTAANLFVGKKNLISKERGGGNDQNAQYISLIDFVYIFFLFPIHISEKKNLFSDEVNSANTDSSPAFKSPATSAGVAMKLTTFPDRSGAVRSSENLTAFRYTGLQGCILCILIIPPPLLIFIFFPE